VPSAFPNVPMSGLDAEIFLASPPAHSEAGDHFVQNQQRAALPRKLAQTLQISLARKNAAMFAMMGSVITAASSRPCSVRNPFERSQLVPWGQYHVVKDRKRNAFGVRMRAGFSTVPNCSGG